MFESTSRFPRFFMYMIGALALLIIVAMFFSIKVVAGIYFIALMLSVILLILDKRYGTIITNYKITFMLFDIVNLIAVVTVIYYEWGKHSTVLNILLISLIAIEVALILVDMLVIKNKNLTKRENTWVDLVKIAAMICLITYFFKVSTFYFAIDAIIFELVNLGLKLYVNGRGIQENTEPTENDVVKIIHSAGCDEEDIN